MGMMKFAVLLLLGTCALAPALADVDPKHGQLIHFICDTPDEVLPVIGMVDGGDLVYGITALPGSCKWTRDLYPELHARVGTVGKLFDSVRLENGDRVWVGEVTMPNGKIHYSAGYYDLVS
jgi:hypothetical protein